MVSFNNSESPEEFKHRLNSLTEKLNETNKNLDHALSRVKAVA